ncbi:MAG: hypothetical protein AAF985_22005 [Bacteroidota bacterium]
MRATNRFQSKAIHEFELISNLMSFAAKKAFHFYGVLILPEILGGMILYHGFRLEGASLLIALLILFLVLINIYFYQTKKLIQDHRLRLIINGQTIQILNSQQLFLQQNLGNLDIHFRYTQGYPTLEITAPDIQSLYISYYKANKSIQSNHQLRQPDYWIKKAKAWQQLCRLLKVNSD